MVPRAASGVRAPRAGTDACGDRTAGARFRAIRPRARRNTAAFAVSNLPGYALQRRQDTAQDAGRGVVSLAESAARRERRLYVEIAPGWVWMGGGFYAPGPRQLLRIRQHISDTYPEVHQLVRAPAFRRTVSALDGERLTRMPRGFAAANPAAEYLKYRSFLAGREFAATFATSAAFYPALVSTFKSVMPLVRFLNDPLVDREDQP